MTITPKREANRRFFGLQWHLTDRCDQRCAHCYVWQGRPLYAEEEDLKVEDCFRIVEKLLVFCVTFSVKPIINLTGGDPLLYPKIWELIGYISKKKIPFRILGNPFHLTNDVCQKLKSFGCIAYQLSLDGLEKTHDDIRQKNSFNETIQAIKILNSSGIRTVVMSTVSDKNLEELPDLVDIVAKEEVVVYGFARYCPVNGSSFRDFLSPLKYRNFLSRMWQKFKEFETSRTKFTFKDHLWKLWFYENGLLDVRKEDIVLDGCSCGISHMTLLPDGTVYACRRFDSPVGNIFQSSFEDVFLGKEMEKYREIHNLSGCNTCFLKNYCRGCHAVSYGTYGDYFSKDPQCWISEERR